MLLSNAIKHYYEYENSNVHRGVHTLGSRATDAYEGAREKVCQVYQCTSYTGDHFHPRDNNSPQFGGFVLRPVLVCKEGDEIVITPMEHHSNLIPWQQVAKETGATLKYIPLQPDGNIDLADVEKTITNKTKIVAIAYVSNVMGVSPSGETNC